MENPVYGGPQGLPTTYDYRMYDRIWQRVSPDLTPYPELRNTPLTADHASVPAAPTTGGHMPSTVPTVSSTTAPAPLSSAVPAAEDNNGAPGDLPGAEMNPCCMGSLAQASTDVVAGFIEEELAVRRYCLALSQRVCQESVRQLLRRIARERMAAARQLRAAYYLITGTCHTPAITVEHTQWRCLQESLRSCYHQEACSGLNYQRAADEADDLCLQKLFRQLSQQAYRRAEDVMTLLGAILR